MQEESLLINAPLQQAFGKRLIKKTICDEVILFEIMIDNIDIAFWNAYKIKLQQLLTQNEIIIRASSIQLL